MSATQKAAIELLEVYNEFATNATDTGVEATIDMICKTFGSFDNCIRIATKDIIPQNHIN